MRYLLFLFLGLLANDVLAQAELNWGLQVTPQYSNRRLIAQSTIDQADVRALEELEIGRFAYSAGAVVRWKSERVGFLTGLNFVNIGHQTEWRPVTPSDPAPPNSIEKRTVYRNLFIEAPAELQFFQSFDDKNALFFMMGLTFAYNLNNATQLIFTNGETEEVVEEPTDNEQFADINYSFITGMGWEHQLGERLAFSLQPTFQFWVRPLLTDIDVDFNRNLYSLGFRGILYFN